MHDSEQGGGMWAAGGAGMAGQALTGLIECGGSQKLKLKSQIKSEY